MVRYIKLLLGTLIVAGGVGFWAWTPWWLWGTAFVFGGVGVARLGGVMSFVCLAAAAALLALGYAVQPDALELLEKLAYQL